MTLYELVEAISKLRIPSEPSYLSCRAMLSIVVDAAKHSLSDIGKAGVPGPPAESPNHSKSRYRIKWRHREHEERGDKISVLYGRPMSLDLARSCCAEANSTQSRKYYWYEEILPEAQEAKQKFYVYYRDNAGLEHKSSQEFDTSRDAYKASQKAQETAYGPGGTGFIYWVGAGK